MNHSQIHSQFSFNHYGSLEIQEEQLFDGLDLDELDLVLEEHIAGAGFDDLDEEL